MFWRAPFVWQVSLLKECDHPNVIRQCHNSRKVCRSVISQSHEPFEGFMRCCPWTELCTWCLSMWIWPGPQGNSAGNVANSRSYRRAWNAGPRISAFSWKGHNFSVAPLAEMDSIQPTPPPQRTEWRFTLAGMVLSRIHWPWKMQPGSASGLDLFWSSWDWWFSCKVWSCIAAHRHVTYCVPFCRLYPALAEFMEPLPAFDRTKLAEQTIVLIVPSQEHVWVKSWTQCWEGNHR